MAIETTSAARQAYDDAYLRVLSRALELGGFPPAEALDRAVAIRDECAAWADPVNFLPCQEIGLEEVAL